MASAKYVDNNNPDIKFNHIHKFVVSVGSKLAAEPYEYDDDDNLTYHANVINAIDIDWNAASLPGIDREIETTSDLLKVVSDINEKTNALEESINEVNPKLSENYAMSESINQELHLHPDDTYEEAFGKIEKAICDYEYTVAMALNDLNDRTNAKANTEDVYSKEDADAIFLKEHQDISYKANAEDVYTKDEIDEKIANIESGNPVDLENYATKDYVSDKIAEVVGEAPEALDTLKEIADKLGDNDDAVSALTASIASKANSEDVYTKDESDSKYLTEHQSLEDYATKTFVEESINEAINNIEIPDATLVYNVTYQELVDLVNSSMLKDGCKYRITDYALILNPETYNDSYRSANHSFDIIVEALSNSTLSEFAKAIQNENDTYFENSKLNKWELKYTIDNIESYIDPVNGKGTIYYMKDEFGNEAPYDFKNFQFDLANNGIKNVWGHFMNENIISYKFENVENANTLKCIKYGEDNAQNPYTLLSEIENANDVTLALAGIKYNDINVEDHEVDGQMIYSPVWAYTFSIKENDKFVDASLIGEALKNSIENVYDNAIYPNLFVGNCAMNKIGIGSSFNVVAGSVNVLGMGNTGNAICNIELVNVNEQPANEYDIMGNTLAYPGTCYTYISGAGNKVDKTTYNMVICSDDNIISCGSAEMTGIMIYANSELQPYSNLQNVNIISENDILYNSKLLKNIEENDSYTLYGELDAKFVSIDSYNALLSNFEKLVRKVNNLHPDYVDNTYSITLDKPTSETIAQYVNFDTEKPEDVQDIDMTSLAAPTIQYLVYPLAWEVVENDMLVKPIIRDENGFEIGAWYDEDTPIIEHNGIQYRVLNIELGKMNYTIEF